MNRKIEELEKRSLKIRKEIIRMAHYAKTGHIGSALSVVDILTALYFKVLYINPRCPQAKNRDRFILSKGHGAAALYATLCQRGFFSRSILKTYLADGSSLAAHPVFHHIPGIELSTGSLGHGLSVGVGMALAGKVNGEKHRIFVVLSDGECDEGSTWEAAMAAAHLELDNLVVIVDYNKIQAFGRKCEVMDLEPFSDKWEAFGFSVDEIDGHNMGQITRSLENIPFKRNKPSVIIAHTLLGKGVSFMEDKLEWHYNTMTDEHFHLAVRELTLK